ATVRAYLLDANGLPCLDARNWIRFGITGDGTLIQNQGTSSGSAKVQLYNGRALIRVRMNNGLSVISAKVDSIPTVILSLQTISPYADEITATLRPFMLEKA